MSTADAWRLSRIPGRVPRSTGSVRGRTECLNLGFQRRAGRTRARRAAAATVAACRQPCTDRRFRLGYDGPSARRIAGRRACPGRGGDCKPLPGDGPWSGHRVHARPAEHALRRTPRPTAGRRPRDERARVLRLHALSCRLHDRRRDRGRDLRRPHDRAQLAVMFASQPAMLAGLLRSLPPSGSSLSRSALEIARRAPGVARASRPHFVAACEVAQMLAHRLGLPARLSSLFADMSCRRTSGSTSGCTPTTLSGCSCSHLRWLRWRPWPVPTTSG